MQPRPPIVTVLGHVDHGKTTLLDHIRKTSIASSEAGGITQHIGAYDVTTPHGEITFIDTPGHAAFSAMRSRGAKVADIAILVVAANEGVKPQTREALDQIRQAKLPFIVAATKIDLSSADVEVMKGQLEKEGVLLEGRGGDVPVVGVSAKTGEGVDHFLELITLLAQVHEIKGDPDAKLEGVVIESKHDQRRGALATVVVRSGSILPGQTIYAENVQAKVRALTDSLGRPVKQLLPGRAAEVLGFMAVPTVGANLSLTPGTGTAQEYKVGKVEKNKLQLVVKADTAGTLEALVASIDPRTVILSRGVGEVSQNDVMLASSFNALILAYAVKVTTESEKLATEEKVVIKKFALIYEALQWVTEVIEGKQKSVVETILGRGEIVAEFPFGDKERIAGIRVKEGRIAKSDVIRIMRGEAVVGESRLTSIKQHGKPVDIIQKGEECGIVFTSRVDFQAGDMVLSAK